VSEVAIALFLALVMAFARESRGATITTEA
jgi:hypothetical protein